VHFGLSPEAIAQGHILFGMSQMTGGFVNTRVVPERHYFTDEELLIEGKLIADHVGTIGAFPDQPLRRAALCSVQSLRRARRARVRAHGDEPGGTGLGHTGVTKAQCHKHAR
jgi:hypothetical protein